MMKINKLSLWLSSVALIISIVTFFMFWLRFEPFTIDSNGFFGWVTCAFTLLVTILVGWQIFNVISINKQVDDKIKSTQNQTDSLEKSVFLMFDKEKQHLDDEMDRKNIELFYTISITMVDRFWKTKNFQIINNYLVLALNAAIELNSKKKVEDVLGILKNSLSLKESFDSMDQDLISEFKENLEKAAQISPKVCEIFAML